MGNPYEILFEPVRIGPVTAPNRFYQVPHCNGFGHRMPQGLARMRGIKAEGGWGVVCTEEVETTTRATCLRISKVDCGRMMTSPPWH